MGTDLNIGHVTAYAYAKSKGYTGTEEQFATELAQFAENAQQVAEDKAAVEELVDEFLNTTAPAVIQDVTDEGTSQVERVADAGTAQVTRVGEAGNTQIDAVAAAGTTQIGLVTAEGTTQVTRVQDKGDEVIDSIPADYTALTQEVSDLNRHINLNTGTTLIEWNDGHGISTNVTTAVDIDNPNTSADWRCAVLSCLPGDVFTITASSNNVAPRAWAFLGSDKKVLCAEGAKLSCVNKVLVAPRGAAYLVLNDNAKNADSFVGMLATIAIQNSEYSADNIAVFNDWNLCNAKGTFVRENQYVKDTGGSGVSQPDYFAIDNISCEPFVTYEFYSDYSTSTARFINYYKADGTRISTVQNKSTDTAPAESAYMCVSFHYKVSGTDGNQTKGNYYCKVAENRNNQNAVDFGENVLSGKGVADVHNDDNRRKATINFQFDDGNSKDADIVDIFDARGVKCGFALPTSITDANMARYVTYQAKGYEIISHSTDGTGMNDETVDASTIETKLKISLETLESKGFIVKGWVTPNSTMAQKFKPLLRKYYQWAVTSYYGGYSGTGTPYTKPGTGVFNLYRVAIENTDLANMKAAVDEAIANCGCLSFYSHATYLDSGSTYLTTENLEELLDYVNAKAALGLCEVKLPSESIINYFNVRNDDVSGGWIEIPSNAVSMDANMDSPLAWYVNYNPMLKLLSFDARLRPLTSTSSEFALCTLPVKSLTAVPIFNELNLDMRFYDGVITVYSNWPGMAMNRIHFVCRIT